MRKICILLLLSFNSAAQNSDNILLKKWLEFPVYRTPSLKNDEGVKILYSNNSKEGKTKLFFSKNSLIDTKNLYANLSLADDGYLEFIVWQGKTANGAILLNRYRGNEQKFSLWLFDSKQKLVDSTYLLSLSPSLVKAAYRSLSGQEPKTAPKLHWEFPRKGTTIVISLEPTTPALLARCKVLQNNNYDCGSKLDIAQYSWTGETFKLSWIKR